MLVCPTIARPEFCCVLPCALVEAPNIACRRCYRQKRRRQHQQLRSLSSRRIPHGTAGTATQPGQPGHLEQQPWRASTLAPATRRISSTDTSGRSWWRGCALSIERSCVLNLLRASAHMQACHRHPVVSHPYTSDARANRNALQRVRWWQFISLGTIDPVCPADRRARQRYQDERRQQRRPGESAGTPPRMYVPPPTCPASRWVSSQPHFHADPSLCWPRCPEVLRMRAGRTDQV